MGRNPRAGGDAYFDGAGRSLLAGLILAAATAQRPVTDVHGWLTDPTDTTPAALLRHAGHTAAADAVRAVVTAPDRQRAGVYGTALQMVACLTNPTTTRWVTPPADRRARAHRSDPAAFVTSTDTLYSLSREGRGSAGALVTALTVAVTQAAEHHATTHPGGRLPVPLTGVLDEAANVCRWRDLPQLYSHYGSRGILLRRSSALELPWRLSLGAVRARAAPSAWTYKAHPRRGADHPAQPADTDRSTQRPTPPRGPGSRTGLPGGSDRTFPQDDGPSARPRVATPARRDRRPRPNRSGLRA